jgi:two-component system, sensor histidine kinase YesM
MFYRLSFRHRIWIAFMLIVTLAVTAAGILSYRIAANAVERNAYELSQETLLKTSQMLDEKLNRIMQSVYSLMVSSAYRRAFGLDSSFSEVENYYTHLSSLQAAFVQTKLNEPLIHSLLIATPAGDYYQTSQTRLFEHTFYRSELYERIRSERTKLWIEGHEDPFFSSKERVVSFVMEGLASNTYEDIYVVANVKEDALKSFMTAGSDRRNGHLLLVASSGAEVIQADADIAASLREQGIFAEALRSPGGSFEYVSGGDEFLVNYTKLAGVQDWTLFSILPKVELMRQMDSIQLAIIGIIAGCLLVSFVFADMLTRVLFKPLNQLQMLMKKVEMNDLNVRYESEYQDEISQLGYRFNRMLVELNRLFSEVTQAEQEKRRMEIKALQAQIDPHFLYNTLNTIYWKSQMKQLNDVQEMVLALSRLFQLGLNKGNEWTTLEFELMHVEQYLMIQQKCYETMFTYSIDIDPEVDRQQPILKILLQPLVENSILHGFKDRNEGGIIHIWIRQDEQQLQMTVEDNGLGIEAAALQGDEPLNGGPTSLSSSNLKGYALHNVRRRLQLEYGDKAELELESEPSVFTRVTIRVPIVSRDYNRGAKTEHG